MRWLEVSLTLSGELIEPVADVLQRVTSQGIAVTPAEAGDPSISEKSKLDLRAYLPVNSQMEASRQEIRRALAHLRMIRPLPEPQFRIIEEEAWVDAWKSHYQPLAIGDRLLILPSWHEPEAGGRIPIRLDPGMAFGTGTHPTTQMCLRALEEHIKPGMFLIDLGSGSGILSIAAAVLGAGAVVAADTDEDAVVGTRRNVQANGVAAAVQVLQGGLDVVLEYTQATGRAADLTVANILSRVIIQMLEEGLTDTLREGGILLLSGILDEQTEEVMAACQRQGLSPLKRYAQADWRALMLKK